MQMMPRILVSAEQVDLAQTEFGTDYTVIDAWVSAILKRSPDVWHSVWFPDTSEANYDVIRWNSETEEVETAPEFNTLSDAELAQMGVRR